jgi:transcriptional regulator GlxA family with amidase domain
MKIARTSAGFRTRRIVMLAFPDAQIIDIAGPLEVFGRATRWMTDERGSRVPAYTV